MNKPYRNAYVWINLTEILDMVYSVRIDLTERFLNLILSSTTAHTAPLLLYMELILIASSIQPSSEFIRYKTGIVSAIPAKLVL
jgi:hypothetical protein